MQLNIITNSGWLGIGNRSIAERRDSMQRITINDYAWDKSNLLMPSSIRQLMLEQQEMSLTQDLLDRIYAPDNASESDLIILPSA